ncbi:MAG: hypothetical protein ACRD1K_01050 [Acidimicrobiales bacterium]
MAAGQISDILASLNDKDVSTFADQEAELVPVLAPRSLVECCRAMASWAAHVDTDGPDPAEPAIG